jgi:hypothetical protein
MYALGWFCYGVKPDYAFMATVERLSDNRLIMARLNADKSSGFRLVTQFPPARVPGQRPNHLLGPLVRHGSRTDCIRRDETKQVEG